MCVGSVDYGLGSGLVESDSYAAQGALVGGSSDLLVQASAFAFATCDVLSELGSAKAQPSSEAPFGSD